MLKSPIKILKSPTTILTIPNNNFDNHWQQFWQSLKTILTIWLTTSKSWYDWWKALKSWFAGRQQQQIRDWETTRRNTSAPRRLKRNSLLRQIYFLFGDIMYHFEGIFSGKLESTDKGHDSTFTFLHSHLKKAILDLKRPKVFS